MDKSARAKASTKQWTAKTIEEAARLKQDAAAHLPAVIDLAYLMPLAQRMVGDAVAEKVVSRVSKGSLDVRSLAKLVEGCVAKGEFDLLRQGNLTGKHHNTNYKSAEESPAEVTKALHKRLSRGHTRGPYHLPLDAIPFDDYACNSIGAVPKKGSTDMRPVDDMAANADIVPPSFSMPAIEYLRMLATKGCYWWVVDIEDAFANLALAPKDRPWMMFRWYDVDDVNHNGTSHDALYMHVKGNFGPRPLPYWYTMLQLYINITFMAVCDVAFPPIGFIDDNTHKSNTQQQAMRVMTKYKAHVRAAGVWDKVSKEQLPFQLGVILGRYFDSISMTISITTDKLLDLMAMMVNCGNRLTLKHVEGMMGLWEFCQECLPIALRTFAFNTHAWMAKMRQYRPHPKTLHWMPSKCRRDISVVCSVLPLCNGKQPLQPMRQRQWQRPVFTDASMTGGGYCSPTLAYARTFTCRERKQTIAVLEAKMVEEAVAHNAHQWRNSIVPIYIDNTTALGCLSKGRAKRSEVLNGIVRSTLLTCAQHDIILTFHWVPTASNTLADALSRQWWRSFSLGLEFFVWPDTGTTLTRTEIGDMRAHLQQHAPRLNTVREKYTDEAFAKGSEATWASGWKAWQQFCAEAMVEPMAAFSDADFDMLLGTFRAALGDGSYGMGQVKRRGTQNSYCDAVRHKRDSFFKPTAEKDVKRGMARIRGKDTKPKPVVTLDVACDLMVHASIDNMEQLRNCTAYCQLGQGTSRAQTATVSRTAMMEKNWETERVLMVADVVIDTDLYGVRYGLRKQEKQDYGGNLRNDEGIEWIYVSGKKGSVLDAVAVTTVYVQQMGFDKLSDFEKSETPFYQEIYNNFPTSRPLQYDSFLRSFRRDLLRLPRDKYPFEDWSKYGVHAWRRFGATVAHLNGVPNDLVQELGRWRSDSFLSYFVLSHEEGFARQANMLADGHVVQTDDGRLQHAVEGLSAGDEALRPHPGAFLGSSVAPRNAVVGGEGFPQGGAQIRPSTSSGNTRTNSGAGGILGCDERGEYRPGVPRNAVALHAGPQKRAAESGCRGSAKTAKGGRARRGRDGGRGSPSRGRSVCVRQFPPQRGGSGASAATRGGRATLRVDGRGGKGRAQRGGGLAVGKRPRGRPPKLRPQW